MAEPPQHRQGGADDEPVQPVAADPEQIATDQLDGGRAAVLGSRQPRGIAPSIEVPEGEPHLSGHHEHKDEPGAGEGHVPQDQSQHAQVSASRV